jgi:hypothetical protein
VHLFSGSVRELAYQLSTSELRARFVTACEKRYADRYGKAPGEGERRSWHNSWPRLLQALEQASLDDLHLFLEFELPACSERADAVLLGTRADGALTAVVIELKQWDKIEQTTSTRTIAGGREYSHPCAQAAGYVGYLRDWLNADHLRLEVRGVAVLHDAMRDVAARLRAAADEIMVNREIGILCASDLARPATELSKHLLADDLEPPTAEVVREFLDVEHRPSERLLTRLADVVRGDRVFDLVGAQQDAYLTVLDKIARARAGGKHLIVVTGGPGEARRVIDSATLERVAAVYRSGGWPASVEGDAITAPYSTPSAGPAPWYLYRLALHTAFGVASAEPHGATRWDFAH